MKLFIVGISLSSIISTSLIAQENNLQCKLSIKNIMYNSKKLTSEEIITISQHSKITSIVQDPLHELQVEKILKEENFIYSYNKQFTDSNVTIRIKSLPYFSLSEQSQNVRVSNKIGTTLPQRRGEYKLGLIIELEASSKKIVVTKHLKLKHIIQKPQINTLTLNTSFLFSKYEKYVDYYLKNPSQTNDDIISDDMSTNQLKINDFKFECHDETLTQNDRTE